VNRGLIFDIRRFTVHDGPGIRTTVFFKGCPLRCRWCHNPESQDMGIEETVKTIVLDEKTISKKETLGKWITVDEVLSEIEKDRIFYDESGGGVTLSGGEPLFQPVFLLELLDAIKAMGIHTTLDTCGFADKATWLSVVSKPDLFLFDIKLMNDADHLKYTGVSNKQILQNLFLLIDAEKKIILRFPVISEITDTTKNIDGIKELLGKVKDHIQQVDLLPYHGLGNAKYKRLGKTNKMGKTGDLTKEDVAGLKTEFEDCGVNVRIGG
jgi:pyruvate formate lyase activating enzyme